MDKYTGLKLTEISIEEVEKSFSQAWKVVIDYKKNECEAALEYYKTQLGCDCGSCPMGKK